MDDIFKKLKIGNKSKGFNFGSMNKIINNKPKSFNFNQLNSGQSNFNFGNTNKIIDKVSIHKGFNINTTHKQFINSKPPQVKNQSKNNMVKKLNNKEFYWDGQYYRNVNKVAGKENLQFEEFLKKRKPNFHMNSAVKLNPTKFPFFVIDYNETEYNPKTGKITDNIKGYTYLLYWPETKVQSQKAFNLLSTGNRFDNKQDLRIGAVYKSGLDFSDNHHRELGRNLGYHEDEINSFISRIRRT